MASPNPNSNRTPMYPQIIDHNHNPKPDKPSSSPSLYPKLEMKDLIENLFPDSPKSTAPSAPPESVKETLISVSGTILHLIDKQYSVELACGDFSVLRLMQGDNAVAILARIGDEIQWPLTRDQATVKLDHSHYFFSFRAPKVSDDDDDSEFLSYGLTIATKGQDELLRKLDEVLENCCSFSVQKVEKKGDQEEMEVLDASVANELLPADLKSDKKKEVMEKKCQAYWTTLAPNVEDYNGIAAKLVAAGSGQLIKGILWCGDVTADRLKWGNEVLKKRMAPGSNTEISPQTLKRIKRVKRVTKMTEKVAGGVLSGVVKVSGFFTGSVANSKVGKKFFGLLPGEMVLASLDGFNKVCDAVEVAGKNVMSTSSTVTTELVSQKYGEEAAKAASEGLDAAGHAVGAAWTVFKIRKAMNPKSVIKPSALAKSAASDMKSKSSK